MERRTRQRDVIRQTIDRLSRPLSVQEVLDEAQTKLPRLGQATVYRAIGDLLDQGWLKTVEMPGEPMRYERANLGHHHHFHCRQCDRVFDVEGCVSQVTKLAPRGFQVQAHEIILYGVCADCRQRD